MTKKQENVLSYFGMCLGFFVIVYAVVTAF